MTINELIQRLEEYEQELGGEAEVRLMTQSNWPFEYGITGLASRAEIYDAMRENDEDGEAENDGALFIVEGQQICYGAKEAWNAAH